MEDCQLLLDFNKPLSSRPLEVLNPDELYAAASAEFIPKLLEDSRVERKPPGIHRESLSEYFSMWANTSPEGGLIVIGVSDDGQLVGCLSVSQDKMNQHEKVGRELCPDALYDTKRVEIVRAEDGKRDFILLVRVRYREDKVVETNKGQAFRRRGDSKFRLMEEEKRELMIDKGQVLFEQEPCGLYYPDDFDSSAIAGFASSVKEKKGLQTDHTPEQILANRKLGTFQSGQFVPNIACALLFAKSPNAVIPGCMIRFQRYEGTEKLTGEKRNVVKDEFIEGRVPEIIVQANRLVESQIRTFSRLGRDGKFFTAPEYPQAAWFEAIVNACVHRSYSLRNMNVFIKMFDDRLVIESPGPFPPFVTPENIYEVHHRRNYFLMDAMFYMDFVKCENEGTRRMRDVMLKMELPEPEFEQKEIGNALVRVTLRNNQAQRDVWIDKDASHLVGEAIFKTLSEKERRCINFAAEHGSINVSEAQRLIEEKTWHGARTVLKGLAQRGLFEYVSKFDRDPNAHFQLNSVQTRKNGT